MGGHQSTTNLKDEWLTPPSIIDALGGADSFDLDPCAPVVRPWPMARQHYTIADDGLSKPWFGRVWFNPPYGKPKIVGPWMRRMAQHGVGTALIFARTETDLFFETVWNVATAILFVQGRVWFHHVTGEIGEHNGGAPSSLIAYGERDALILQRSDIAGHFVRLRDAPPPCPVPAP